MQTKSLHYETIEDKLQPGDYRVEAIDAEGGGEVYIAIFVGPDAEARANEYAEWKNSDSCSFKEEIVSDGWWVECKFTGGKEMEEYGPEWGPYEGAKNKRDAIGWARFELESMKLKDEPLRNTKFAIAKYKNGKRDESSFLEISLDK